MTRAVPRSRIRMADRTDHWRRTAEELLFVAAETGFVLWVFGDIGKRVRTCPDLVPVVGWKFVTRRALERVGLLIVRETRIPGRLRVGSIAPGLRMNRLGNLGVESEGDRRTKEKPHYPCTDQTVRVSRASMHEFRGRASPEIIMQSYSSSRIRPVTAVT